MGLLFEYTTPWQFGSCGSISLAKIFEIALGREFEPWLGKFLELARIYHKFSPHKLNCHGVSMLKEIGSVLEYFKDALNL